MPLLGFGAYQNYTTTQSVLQALDAGYRHIDTAQAYRNEAHVGEAVRLSPVDRSDIFVTTKIISKYHGYEKTAARVDESLKQLGFDYIDLFLIHDPFAGKQKRLETYRALLDAQKAKKIRSVGVSNYGVHHLKEIEDAGLARPAVNQIELHPKCQQRPIVEYCRQNDIVIQAYCPIIRGKMDDPVIHQVSAKYGARDPAQILLRWSLQKGFVPLVKSANPERIISNTHLYDFQLDEEDMHALDELDQGDAGFISGWANNPTLAP
ncbi:Aldo/keto reductase [Fistulina hepatica ATCC 64428]|uniref:Aldo/keto reductase n=1 Tax=Fistulina hepatica ATCC 64428 TaxID=1128425 RepID=A0A0D7ADN0_9AGAR|nr:Aldo/keto reductase [Fistulina hepatica ATCC 64428]